MPVNRTQQYSVTCPAGELVTGVSPHVPKRVLLVIQNTGANPGLFRIEKQVQLDGGDYVIAAGAELRFVEPENCPSESLNFYSALGTTFAVFEGVVNG